MLPAHCTIPSDDLMNLTEIDVATLGTKNDLNYLVEDSKIPSLDGSFKIYILIFNNIKYSI